MHYIALFALSYCRILRHFLALRTANLPPCPASKKAGIKKPR